MNNDVSILIDGNNTIIGAYAGMHSDKGQTSEFVYIEYYPFNAWFGKPRRYAAPVKKEWVHFVPAVRNGMDGIPMQIVFIYNPESAEGLAKYIRTTSERRINELIAQNKEKFNQIAALKQELLSAKAGAVNQLAESRKVVKNNNSEDDKDNNNPFKFGRFYNGGN